MHRINIAIDGYSSCGKSTLAKQLAKELGYVYVDSGAMYRAVTLFAMRNSFFDGLKLNTDMLITALPQINIRLIYNKDTGLQVTRLNSEDVENEIRKMPVSVRVSQVATVKEVRVRMVYLQQQMAKHKGVVMDGRDIGTVVLPNAELKIFMTAAPEIRAQRRMAELEAKGEVVSINEVLSNIKYRDYVDENRQESPLQKAVDARILDNSNLSPQQQLKIVKRWVEHLVL